MNRNLDGTLLSVDQLVDMTVGLGKDPADAFSLHNPALIRSKLLAMTGQHRFGLFMAGDLSFGTAVFSPEVTGVQQRAINARNVAVFIAELAA